MPDGSPRSRVSINASALNSSKGDEQAVDLGVVGVGGETDPQTGVDFEVQRAERLVGIERACRRENVAGGQESVGIGRVLVAEGEEEVGVRSAATE